MESVRSAFHAQLATVMDSLLAAAVCEIAKIFESSLCDQQAELAQKTEEISVLRCKLENRERRRPRAKEGEVSPGGGIRQHTGSGPNAGKDVSSDSDSEEALCMLKEEEVLGHDGASVKHEHAGSRSVTIEAADGNLPTRDDRQSEGLSAPQTKTKISNWNQSSHGADPRPLQDQASAPFLSISQSGRCSPRTDPSLPQPGEWLPGLDAARGDASGLESLRANGSGCSAPAGGSSSTTNVDPSCFRPAFRSDETSNDGDGSSFSFLDQESENQNSEQSPGVGPRAGRSDHPQASSGETTWQTGADRAVRSPNSHTRRITNFGTRDPLQPQLNAPSLAKRQLNTLVPAPAPGGGNGRPYSCPYCTKCFTYPSHQRRHLLRHTGVRLHPCQFCDKSFLTPSELTVHTRTHTGERPFGCAQCGKRFARSGNLRAHQRDVHMGKRPFACAECGKRFAHRGNLRVHNHRVHQGDPYYIDDQPEPDIGPNAI
ncbi:oocyte zinc finger protein XlCOF7.1 [Kryptolebias marmoratus]|uniref:Oocyte zinc finger protein XlCOF7.1-like n=1 Tax=Kryptolebias marmoratus TaxID=37003 RepID=A0A3Q3AJS7_KRYMA|nr:oocyte zinc finger protein XlCOF7.1 [Kryptolebias marmoratus]